MKGVIVAAGYGTRFLPITKTIPKEMLPLLDKPLIDFILDEFEEAGIKDVIIITSRRKKTLDDYTDREVELEQELLKSGKEYLLERIRPRDMNFTFIRQIQMKGTGHALLSAKSAIGNDNFVVVYPDDIVLSKPGLSSQMIALYKTTGKNVIAVREEYENVSRYGVVDIYKKDGLNYVKGIVEKPKPQDAPSNMISIGRFLFTREILDILERLYSEFTGKGEFYQVDAMDVLCKQEKVLAHTLQGIMLDTGEPLSYFRSLLVYAAQHSQGKLVLDEFYNHYYNK